MGFSYQLNALTEDELAKDAKEEFGETKNLLEVFSLVHTTKGFSLQIPLLFSDLNERFEGMDGKISSSALNSAGRCGQFC